MKLGDTQLDETDRRILAQLQEDCKVPLAQVGKRVGLSAPSVMERIRRLEEAGIVTGYCALVDSRRVGLDVTAFIGISMTPDRPSTASRPSWSTWTKCSSVTT